MIYLEELLKSVGILESDKFEYQLTRTHPDTNDLEVIYGQPSLTGFVSSHFEISVPNGEWFLQVNDKTISGRAPLQDLNIIIALVLSLGCSTSLFLLMKQPIKLTELVENKTAQLEKMALSDSLTGLANRYEFERQAERLLLSAKHEGLEHVLCYMDLDQFKVINDTCGHVAGDELLRQLCQVLRKTFRNNDLLCRMGGDEFGLLIENCSLESAEHIVESIHGAVQGFLFIWRDRIFRVGISIGITSINKDVKDMAELLSGADAACYIAKDSGRNRIHTHYSDDAQIVQQRDEMRWVAKIHHALEKNRFRLYAQPIVSLNSDTGVGYELLIRMQDDHDNLIMPGAFLPSAEHYNLMEQLDRWTIKSALKALASAPDFMAKTHYFSINLSGQLLSNTKFLNFIVEEIKANSIDGS